jgi:hypothetical protein
MQVTITAHLLISSAQKLRTLAEPTALVLVLPPFAQVKGLKSLHYK